MMHLMNNEKKGLSRDGLITRKTEPVYLALAKKSLKDTFVKRILGNSS